MKKPLINQQRMVDTFLELVQIDSISKEEGEICKVLKGKLEALGAQTHVDDAGDKVKGDCGNLIAHIPGAIDAPPLLLSAHMDTVEPGRGVKPEFKDGIFTSSGNTILGADDKCGLSIILEVLAAIQENRLSCGPLDIAFTICEEIGLQGAKHLDFNRVNARIGYVLDTRNPDVIITRAPALNKLVMRIDGRAAHAGAEPEKGINAIALAASAIDALDLGRIDDETTCNIGTIQGGRATNIVPDSVTVRGEVRSHDKDKLQRVTDTIVQSFQIAVDDAAAKGNDATAKLTAEVVPDFTVLNVDKEHQVVSMAQQAAANLGRTLSPAKTGGGSDANVFNEHGITACVLGIGCSKVHTVDEQASLDGMTATAELLMEVLQNYARKDAS